MSRFDGGNQDLSIYRVVPAFPETDHLFLNGLVGTEMKIGYPEIDLISLWYSMIAFSFNADDFHM